MMLGNIFILGKNRELSIAEIIMYYRHRNVKMDFRMIAKNAILVESDFIPEAESLGGTIKIIKIIDEFRNFDPYLVDAPQDHLKAKNNVFNFGISVYGKSRSWTIKNTGLFRVMQKNIKDILKSRGIKSKFVKFSGEVDNVMLAKKHINDIIIFFRGDSGYVGITDSFSNPLEFKKRDEKKPIIVPTMGIPIRLAKIMLNLAGVMKGKAILDPFCGTGIILQEAVIMGAFINGSDIDEKMVSYTKKNLSWVLDEYKISGIRVDAIIKKVDVAKLTKAFPQAFDAIATEPYFGPAIKRLSSMKTAKHLINKSVIIYETAIKQISAVLRKGGYLCIVVPSYRTNKGNIHMNFRKIFTRHGLEEVNIYEGLKQPFREEKKTLTREIFLLVKK